MKDCVGLAGTSKNRFISIFVCKLSAGFITFTGRHGVVTFITPGSIHVQATVKSKACTMYYS